MISGNFDGLPDEKSSLTKSPKLEQLNNKTQDIQKTTVNASTSPNVDRSEHGSTFGGPETPAFVPRSFLYNKNLNPNSLKNVEGRLDKDIFKNNFYTEASSLNPIHNGQTEKDLDEDLFDLGEREEQIDDDEDSSNIYLPPKGEPEACLFVASLNAQRSDEQLTESVTRHFAKWGTLMGVKVMKDWMNRPYAFVQFGTIEDAQKALEESHDTVVDGRHIRVEQARVNRTLFLTKLPKTLTQDILLKYLEKWGKIENVTILENSATGRSKGCGFAKFRYREDAIRAYLHIRQQGKWSVEWASNIEKHQPETDRHSIFVGQLNSLLVTEDSLLRHFSKYGSIESVQLVNKNGEAFAFIRFEDEESAQLAKDNENGNEFLDQKIRVQLRETPEAKSIKKPSQSHPIRSASSSTLLGQSYSPALSQGSLSGYDDVVQHRIMDDKVYAFHGRGASQPMPTEFNPYLVYPPQMYMPNSDPYFRPGSKTFCDQVHAEISSPKFPHMSGPMPTQPPRNQGIFHPHGAYYQFSHPFPGSESNPELNVPSISLNAEQYAQPGFHGYGAPTNPAQPRGDTELNNPYAPSMGGANPYMIYPPYYNYNYGCPPHLPQGTFQQMTEQFGYLNMQKNQGNSGQYQEFSPPDLMPRESPPSTANYPPGSRSNTKRSSLSMPNPTPPPSFSPFQMPLYPLHQRGSSHEVNQNIVEE